MIFSGLESANRASLNFNELLHLPDSTEFLNKTIKIVSLYVLVIGDLKSKYLKRNQHGIKKKRWTQRETMQAKILLDSTPLYI